MLKKILNTRLVLLFFLPFTFGLITVFSFQPFNFSFINFVILPALFLLVVYIKKRSKSIYRKKPFYRYLFLVGFFFGFGFYLSGIFWISYSLTFDENFKFLIPISLILIPLFLGIFTGIPILIFGQFFNNNFSSILLFSGSLALSDFFRGKILTGFPWNLFSYSLSWLTEVLQILNTLGLYAFNLVVITVFTLPALLFSGYDIKKKTLIFGLFFTFLFSVYIYGSTVINKNRALINYLHKEKTLYSKVISPSFKLEYNLPIEEIERRLKKLIKYSDPDKSKSTLFIWPEGVFTGYSLEDIYEFKNLIKNNFSNDHTILFGINTYEKEKVFNSLVLINNQFEVLYQYNKKKLVPFGEFLPFENILSKIGLKKITEGHISFSEGKKQENIRLKNLNILPLICYEIIFPELVQTSSNNTNLIINISEDGWFGDSIGPHQHLAKSIFRAIENDTFLLRSANKGISVIINNKGEVIKRINANESGNIEMDIPLIESEYKNKNDLIFLFLLFTYLFIFLIFKKRN